MILLDNTQILLSAIFSQYPNPQEIVEKDPLNLIRHITLNTYRMYKNMFSEEYGQLVICQDSNNYWRKDIFPFYKQNRKKSQQENQEYWNRIFDSLHQIRTEISENLPYKNIKIDRCEADDIIAVLTLEHYDKEKILIVSNDKDFQQLLKYPNVTLYSPQKKKNVVCDNPEEFLREQIIRGDSSDGIPNVLSEEDTFVVDGKRQKPITQKKILDIYSKLGSNTDPTLTNRYQNNEKLIDLSYIPTEYRNRIIEEYNKTNNKKSNIFNYFVEKRLNNLMDVISEF
jgi:5'-3' exonuclease